MPSLWRRSVWPRRDYLYPLLDSFGIPRERVTLESQAGNTVENAR